MCVINEIYIKLLSGLHDIDINICLNY